MSKNTLYSARLCVLLNPTPAFTQYMFLLPFAFSCALSSALVYSKMFHIFAAFPVEPFVFGSPIAYPKLGVSFFLNSVIPKYKGVVAVAACTLGANIPNKSVMTKITTENKIPFCLIFFSPLHIKI